MVFLCICTIKLSNTILQHKTHQSTAGKPRGCINDTSDVDELCFLSAALPLFLSVTGHSRLHFTQFCYSQNTEQTLQVCSCVSLFMHAYAGLYELQCVQTWKQTQLPSAFFRLSPTTDVAPLVRWDIVATSTCHEKSFVEQNPFLIVFPLPSITFYAVVHLN